MTSENSTGESKSQARLPAVVDIAIVVAVSGAAFLAEDLAHRSGLISLGEDSRGIITVLVGACAAIAMTFARGGSLQDLGFRRPKRWLTVPLWAIGMFAAFLLAQVAGPLLVSTFIKLPEPDLSRYASYHGNLSAAVAMVLILPFTASIPEEIIYRGFLMGRLTRIFGSGLSGDILTVAVQAVVFGAIHIQWGIGGIIVTAIMGLVWGTAFLLCGRNLWIMIIAHSTGHVLLAMQLYLTPPAG